MKMHKYGKSAGERDGAESGYFISISDLMASLIFFFIITIVILIYNYQSEIQGRADKRLEILDSIKREFDKENIPVTINDKEGTLGCPMPGRC